MRVCGKRCEFGETNVSLRERDVSLGEREVSLVERDASLEEQMQVFVKGM